MTPKAKWIWKREMGRRLRTVSVNYFGKKGQHKFANHLGISQGSLSDLINGVSAPSAETLKALTLRTPVDIRWLITGRTFQGGGNY